MSAGGHRAVRKTVTVIFSDVSEWSALAERLDPESLHRVTSRYHDETAAVLERHGGTVEKFIGDAVVAMFGIPTVHEDDALRAVRAAVEIREAVAALNDELERDWGVRLSVHSGISTGEVVAGIASADRSLAIGEAVIVAARLQGVARPGEILLGTDTYRLVRAAVRAEALLPLDVRGRAKPLTAWRVLDLDFDRAAVASPFVGRNREVGTLRDLLQRATRERSCQLCTIAGPPGIGKSRLAREFFDVACDDVTVAVGRCLSYGEGITYWPLREIVQELAGNEPRGWIEARLLGATSAAGIGERVAAAVGAGEGRVQPEETFWAFRKLFEALARERPLVLAIDDVHWAEPTLLDLVEHVVGISMGAPILILCLARPEFFENRPEWTVPQSRRTVISLPPLPRAESRGLVERLERAQELPKQARARAVEAAEGNPLFLEQLVAFESEGGSAAIPPSIHALLEARIDRLDPGERAVLERAAIEGRAFDRSAVANLLPGDERAKLDERLLALVRKDFIQPGQTVLEAEDAFRFRHVLVRDAAYKGMVKELRADLHEQHADWVEARGDEDEIVGYHLEQAAGYRAEVGTLGERRDDLALRAAERLGPAGRAALKRGDILAAVNLLSRATSLPPAEASIRVQLLPDLGEALCAVGELARAGEVLTEATERAGAVEDAHTGWRARLQRTWLRLQADPSVDVADTLSEANAAVAAFERLRDDRALAHAWHLIAWVNMTYGRLSALADAVQHGLEHARAAGDAMTEDELIVLALLVGPTGPLPARRVLSDAEAALERARSSGSRRVEGAALLVLAMCAAFEARFDQARKLLSEATAIDEELGGGRGSGFQYTPAGMIELLAGDTAQAERELRIGYETLRERGDAWFLCGVAAELADVLWLEGRNDEAFDLTRVSEETVGKEVLVAQMMWRGARAKVLARRGQAEEAEALAREGVAIIEGTDHVLYHADALTDLAEVLRLQNREEEAAATAEKAWRLYEQKGNVVAAGKMQALLEDLTSEVPTRDEHDSQVP